MVIVHGSPAEEIVSFSHDKAFDMVVIGTHGRTGFSHVLMGSVAEAVVRRASCAVLTLHIPFPAAGALTIAGTKSEMEKTGCVGLVVSRRVSPATRAAENGYSVASIACDARGDPAWPRALCGARRSKALRT